LYAYITRSNFDKLYADIVSKGNFLSNDSCKENSNDSKGITEIWGDVNQGKVLGSPMALLSPVEPPQIRASPPSKCLTIHHFPVSFASAIETASLINLRINFLRSLTDSL